MRDTRIDPQTGRPAVLLAALLGVAAVIAYAASRGRAHPDASGPTGRTQSASLPDLAASAVVAREHLDVEQLGRLVGELDRSAESTTLAAKTTAAQLELLDVQAALALEASVRAEIDATNRDAAQHAAARSIASVRELSLVLERKGADAGRIEAAMARVELAAGTDITESFPAVLMPTYRDPELRLAALAAPVWRPRGETIEPALLDEIVAQLQGAERQTTLVRLLTAAALKQSGRELDARTLITEVLQETPQQPLARAMQRSLGAAVAVAPSKPTDTPAPERTTGIAEVEPTPTAVPDRPVAEKPVAEKPVAEKPVAKPVAEKPVADDPEPTTTEPTSDPKPTSDTPEPAKPPPSKPADTAPKKKGYDALLAEGCKLVRSGKASEGFAILQQAFDLNPTAVAVTVCMAEAHHELGRDASARALCERALRKSPNDRRALLLAAELEIARGNESAARAHYEKILENHPDDAKAKAYVESHGG